MTSEQHSSLDQLVDVVVVGGGISGLSLGWWLQKLCPNQAQIWLTEMSDRCGGSIVTARNGAGFQWEEGPNSFAPSPGIMRLVVDLGLTEQLVLADRRLPRYIYWTGQLLPVPMSPQDALATPLLSGLSKLRAALGALGFVRPANAQEESIDQFVRRQLGAEVAERLVAPFVSGVYAGDPQALSMAAAFRRVASLEQDYGGLLAGAILSRKNQPKPPVAEDLPVTKPGELGSFKLGLETLPQAIAQKFSHQGGQIKLNWSLQRLEHQPDRTYRLVFHTPMGVQVVQTRSVVLTTPAYVTAQLVQQLAPSLSDALKQIFYPAVAVVAMAYPKAAFKAEYADLRGFGNLNPRGQGIRTLGTIWASSLFSDRAPADFHLLLNFIGGTTDPEVAELSSEQIVQAVDQDLRQILLTKSVTPEVLNVKLWRQAIPQYGFKHLERIKLLNQTLAQLPGLYVSSNYQAGVALGDCINQAEAIAREIRADFLTRRI
ncbi:MAG: protoporphyrinogen oxidase [Pseudanabaenaceae cyanobacterium bins.68]|nr:protoporphyrinogen oxidase [Pseudanabaenaceae cyanobacterium bins.68]